MINRPIPSSESTIPFIWQHDEWPRHLRWDLTACLPALTTARLSQGRLAGKASGIGLELGVELQATALVDEAMTTAAIEGERLDQDSVRLLTKGSVKSFDFEVYDLDFEGEWLGLNNGDGVIKFTSDVKYKDATSVCGLGTYTLSPE